MKSRICLCAAVLILAGFGSDGARAANRNIILFVVDDQGLEAGCYGNNVIKTPNLDRLASEGSRFINAFCTSSSCSASRSVILTGLYSHANGQYGHQHDYHNFHTFTSVLSLPVLLGKAGYRTASVGKYHVQPEAVYHFQNYLKGNQGGARNAVTMAEISKPFIADKSKPFFLYFCPDDPHRSDSFAENLPHKPNFFGNEMKYDGVQEVTYRPEDVLVPSFLPDTAEVRSELAQYYQAVSRSDQGLGKLIQILKETGQYEDTLIIYVSDNGIAFPGAKTTLYDPGMRLPLIVRSPGQKQREVVSTAMISWVDLTPTILDFAGVKPEGDYKFQGRSFLSVLGSGSSEGWDEVYASHTFHEVTMYYPMRAIRTRSFKYILNLAHQLPFPFASDLYESPTWQDILRRGETMYGKRRVADFINRPRQELYDLKSDPDEVINLANDPRYSRTLDELQKKVREFQQRTQDPWIVKYQHE